MFGAHSVLSSFVQALAHLEYPQSAHAIICKRSIETRHYVLEGEVGATTTIIIIQTLGGK